MFPAYFVTDVSCKSNNLVLSREKKILKQFAYAGILPGYESPVVFYVRNGRKPRKFRNPVRMIPTQLLPGPIPPTRFTKEQMPT